MSRPLLRRCNDGPCDHQRWSVLPVKQIVTEVPTFFSVLTRSLFGKNGPFMRLFNINIPMLWQLASTIPATWKYLVPAKTLGLVATIKVAVRMDIQGDQSNSRYRNLLPARGSSEQRTPRPEYILHIFSRLDIAALEHPDQC